MKSITENREKENIENLLQQQDDKREIIKIYSKAVVMKNIIKIKEYSKPVCRGFHSFGGRKVTDEKVTSEKNREYVLYKMREDLWQLANSNFDYGSKFITLTFKENMKDLKVANYEFKKFVDRLKYRYGDFKYIAVIEFQDKYKRGAIHYHMISDLGYIENRELREIWSNGFVRINRIKQVDNVGNYIIKYMCKADDVRLHRRKAYLRSENLEWPEVLINEQVRDLVEKNELLDGDETYFGAYKTEYYGLMTDRIFNLDQTERGRKAREKAFIKKCEKGELCREK